LDFMANDDIGQLKGPELSGERILSAIRKRWWVVLTIAVCVPALTALYLNKQPRIYESTAMIIIESSAPQYLGNQFHDVFEIESNWWNEQELLGTELRVITSLSQATAVTKALCDKRLGHGRAIDVLVPNLRCDDPAQIASVAPVVQGLVRADPQQNTRIVNIVVEYSNPQFAAILANTAAETYIERHLAHRLAQSEGAATWLGDEYGDLSQQLAAAETAIIDFKRKNNVVAVSLEDQQSDLAARRKKLTEELNIIDIKLIAVRAQREEYAQLKSSDPMDDVTPGVVDSPVMIKLKEMYVDQYHKLLELRGRYLDKHPLIIAQEARVAGARADLSREAALAAKNVEASYQMLQKEQKDLKAALDASTHQALELEQRAIEYGTLKRTFDHLAKLSETVGGRERETSLAGHLRTNNVRMLDAAIVPTAAIAPNVPRGVGIALAAGLVIGLALALLLELVDSTVKNAEEIEARIAAPFLGAIPSINPSRDRSSAVAPPPALADVARNGARDLYVVTHPKSAVAECCRAIRTNLLFSRPDNPPRAILVTSPTSEEGKTTTAINLAVVLAQSGLRVLLVDSDMRRPRLHKAFGIPSTADGLSRAIVGEAPVAEQVRETGVNNLWLLPCGATPPNPAELLHADRFKRILEELKGSYDRVIFDSPPVGPVTDASILARMTDGTILVAKFGSTRKDGLVRARKLLSDPSINLLGWILNALDMSHGGKHGYYAGGYRPYYGENEPSDAESPAA
jgi:polysaccharide biosynthesis transport protein